MSAPTPDTGEHPDDGAHVIGWKAVGVVLGVSVRTAQRWERTAGLPVKRIPNGGPHETVYAERAALEAWLKRTQPGPAASASAVDADTVPLATIPIPPGPAESISVDAVAVTAETMPPGASLYQRGALTWPVFIASVCVVACISAVLGWTLARRTMWMAPVARPMQNVGSPQSLIVGDVQGVNADRKSDNSAG